MTIWSMNYHGYTISGDAAKKTCQYQSPEWPNDPRIVKAPSLNTAKRWIREEVWRKGRFPNGDHVYLKKTLYGRANRLFRTGWLIVDRHGEPIGETFLDTAEQARESAYYKGWVLLEHSNY